MATKAKLIIIQQCPYWNRVSHMGQWYRGEHLELGESNQLMGPWTQSVTNGPRNKLPLATLCLPDFHSVVFAYSDRKCSWSQWLWWYSLDLHLGVSVECSTFSPSFDPPSFTSVAISRLNHLCYWHAAYAKIIQKHNSKK